MNIKYLTRKIKSSELSISELAKKAGLARQTIYNIMNESFYPELDSVLAICKALEFNGTELAITLGIRSE